MRVKNVTPSGTEQFVWDGDGLPDLMFVVGSGGAAGLFSAKCDRIPAPCQTGILFLSNKVA